MPSSFSFEKTKDILKKAKEIGFIFDNYEWFFWSYNKKSLPLQNIKKKQKKEIMERKDILARIQDVFREELELDDLLLADETTADDVEEWDSLSHIQLVVALEKEFGLKFTSREILSWDNIGDLVDCINKKL